MTTLVYFTACTSIFLYVFFVFVIRIGVQVYTKNTFWPFKTNNELTCNYDRKITEPE